MAMVGLGSVSRRDFLATGAAAIGAAGVAWRAARAQGPARYRRRNMAAADFPPEVLDSYRKAIGAMLALPPSDPRNWYRIALAHTIDCPHGNWWFVVWHRGFIGWFERICRELSGDANFALPYWDWTQTPRVPAVMFDGVLNPNDPAFIPTGKEFKAKFAEAVEAYWKSLSPDQIDQLLVRGLRFPADLWFDILEDPRGLMFFDQPNARGLTADKPDLDEATTKAVSLPTLLNALGPRDFITFTSPKTRFHSALTGFGVLEGQPHNLVHNCVGGAYNGNGGFMQSNLSPVDPIFFLHHANIDRIWDLWTRKQQALGYPTLPQGADLGLWSREPFLFFVDQNGQPVAQNTAGTYATIGDFNYDYQPGSGEEVVPPADAATAAVAAAPGERVAGVAAAGAATVTLPPALLQQAAPPLFAQVTLGLSPLAHDRTFRILVNAPAAGGDAEGEHDAGTVAIFGHHVVTGPVTFTVPLSAPLASMRANDRLAAGAPLNIRAVAAPTAMQGTGMPQVAAAPGPAADGPEVLSVVVTAQ